MVKSGLSSAWMRADQRSPPRGLAAAPPVSFSRVEGGSEQLKNNHRSYENRARFIAKAMRKLVFLQNAGTTPFAGRDPWSRASRRESGTSRSSGATTCQMHPVGGYSTRTAPFIANANICVI